MKSRILYFIAGFATFISASLFSQNIQRLNKNCPGNWAIFLGEHHHIKEYRDFLAGLLKESKSCSKSTVFIVELPQSYNLLMSKYLRSGAEADLQLFLKTSFADPSSEGIRKDLGVLFKGIYEMNTQNKDNPIYVECIDKEFDRVKTVTLLNNEFHFADKNKPPLNIFDSVFVHSTLFFNKKDVLFRLLSFMSVNDVQLKDKYGNEAIEKASEYLKTIAVPFFEPYKNRYRRDSVMASNFLRLVNKYKGSNFICQFGSDHIQNDKVENKCFYPRILGKEILQNYCVTSAVYFSKEVEAPKFLTENERAYLSKFDSNVILNNSEHEELKEWKNHYDFTIISENVTSLRK